MRKFLTIALSLCLIVTSVFVFSACDNSRPDVGVFTLGTGSKGTAESPVHVKKGWDKDEIPATELKLTLTFTDTTKTVTDKPLSYFAEENFWISGFYSQESVDSTSPRKMTIRSSDSKAFVIYYYVTETGPVAS
ncbi:MAG: hypothetical protein E7374_00525 [Clostridiales bacterium]|nr:hypothetical protein [Clostridiales bacterium]